jgi:hypothetical protein
MTDIVIPISIFKKILNYIDTHSVNEHTRISIRETSCGIGESYEVKISKTHPDDIKGFESGVYATFADFDTW